MEKRTIELSVYTFDELSDDAKQNVWNNYHSFIHTIKDFEAHALTELNKEGIEEITLYSEFGEHRMDGFVFAGKIPVRALEWNQRLRDKLYYTCKKEIVNNVIDCGQYIDIIRVADNDYTVDSLVCRIDNSHWMDFNDYSGVVTAVLSYVKALCNNIERYGYNWFNNYDEADIREWATSNNFMFTDDGRIFDKPFKTLS